jgi:hypothetical protein
MAEQLGDAVLYLRTDDSQLDRGIGAAQGKAVVLGSTFDKTTASTARLSAELTTAGRSAAASAGQFQRSSAVVTSSSAAQRAGMLNLTRQVGDLTTMYSLGAPVRMIVASQFGQIADAAQQALGGGSKLAAVMRGPVGIAMLLVANLAVPLVGKLFETKQAMHDVELAADSMGQAQSAMGGIFDLTTGKIKSQNEMLRLNARLLAYNLQEQAAAKRLSARDAFVGAQQRSFGDVAFGSQSAEIGGFNTTAGATNAAAAQKLLIDIGKGRITREAALKQAESMNFSGTKVSREEFMGAIRDSAWASAADKLASGINKSLDSNALDPMFRQAGAKGRTKKDTGPSAEDVAARHEQAMASLRQQQLQAEEQLATNAQDRADIEYQLAQEEFTQRVAQVKNDKDFTEDQKKAQIKALEALYGLSADGSIVVSPTSPVQRRIALEERRRVEQEAQQLADQDYQARKDALQQQFELADSEAARKAIALKILDADDAYLRSKLEAVTHSQTATDAEKRNAQFALDALNATAGARREGVARANETTVERYLRDLNKTPEQINEAIDRIKIDGLERIGDDLTDVIMRTKSLGAAFHDVANQIVSDLIRIGIEQEVVKPLASLLFGGGGAGGGGLLGKILGAVGGAIGGGNPVVANTSAFSGADFSHMKLAFGGGRAAGGSISPGKFYAVNERSTAPGFFFPIQPGRIEPGSRGASGPAPVLIDLRNSFVDEKLWSRVQAIADRSSRAALAGYDPIVGDRVKEHLARRG